MALTLTATFPAAPAAPAPVAGRFVVGFSGALPLGEEAFGGRIVARDQALGILVFDGLDVAAARLDPRVRYVEPETLRSLLHLTPNDPQFSSQYAPQDVRLPLAWDVTTGDLDAAVCVVDTGARLTHQDLAASRYLGGYDFVQNDTTPQDGQGHGTHTLGIAAASVNNALNIAGAGNVGYYVSRVLDDNGEGFFSTVARGIQWCVDRPAPRLAISMSLGCGGGSLEAAPRHGSGENCDSAPVRDAIANAHSAGRLVVVSAGNDGGCYSCVSFPARLPGVLAIGCNYQTNPCIFTSWGTELALVAPGDTILSLGHASDSATATLSGTSMSAPLVAGAAALYWSHDTAISMPALRDRVRRSAVDLGDAGWDSATGCGRLDVKRLFDGTLSDCAPPTLAACDTTPANDCFANAIPLRQEYGDLVFSNVGAGDEADEIHPCELGASVWFKFRADSTQTAWIYPWNSPPRTSAAIYKAGTSIADLQFRGCSDGFPTSAGPAMLEFPCIAGETYYIQVGGNWAEQGTIRLFLDLCTIGPDVPSAPRNLVATAGSAVGEVALSWLPPSFDGNRTITGYRIERAAAPSGACPSTGFTPVATLDASARSLTEGGLPPATTICFRVTAINAVGDGDFASTTIVVPGPPAAPRLAFIAGGVGEIRLQWTVPVHWGGLAPGTYRIYSAPDASGPFALVREVTDPTRAFTDSGLAPGTTRSYYVTAKNALAEGPPTPTLTARTATAPGVPRFVAAEPGLVPFSIHVEWSAPTSSGGATITAYEVFRDGVLLDRTAGTDRAYEDTDVGPFDTHDYAVRAVNAVGPGPTSGTDCGAAFDWPTLVAAGCG